MKSVAVFRRAFIVAIIMFLSTNILADESYLNCKGKAVHVYGSEEYMGHVTTHEFELSIDSIRQKIAYTDLEVPGSNMYFEIINVAFGANKITFNAISDDSVFFYNRQIYINRDDLSYEYIERQTVGSIYFQDEGDGLCRIIEKKNKI